MFKYQMSILYFLYKGLVFVPGSILFVLGVLWKQGQKQFFRPWEKFYDFFVPWEKFYDFLYQGNFFIAWKLSFSCRKLVPNIKKVHFTLNKDQIFHLQCQKNCFALCPNSFGLRPIFRDFLAFERPNGLSQAKRSLETGLRAKRVWTPCK